jgi:hypothetical protein
MKIALLFYYSVYDDEIRALLDTLECARYVEVPKAWALDGTERRFGTHIYPGTDSVILAFLDDACAGRLVAAIRDFRTQRQKEHTHLAIIPAETVV